MGNLIAAIEKKLTGSKTYGLCALGLGIVAAVQLHWITIPADQMNELLNAVTLAAIAALRAAK